MSGSLSEVDTAIFWTMRVPRVCTAFLAGAALATSGMVFQAIFRNVLATPFTLGVSSGASLGAALYIWSGASFVLCGISGITCAAFVGAISAILIVYGLFRITRAHSILTMLLAGVAISFFFSSLILFGQYMSNVADAHRVLRWLMGRVDVTGFGAVWDLAPFVVCGCGLVMLMTREMNLLIIGEEAAQTRGVHVSRILQVLFFAASLMVAAVVSVCGMIGFVGMMAPHICRLLVGPDHRLLGAASILFGGAFLVVCDVLSRMAAAPAEIPVGVVTALLGGPFFIWLLLKGTGEEFLGA